MNRAGYVSKVPFPELSKPLKGLRDAKGQTLVGLSGIREAEATLELEDAD